MVDSQTRRHLQGIYKILAKLDERIRAIESGTVSKTPAKVKENIKKNKSGE